jgi:hypothetical protein
MTRTKDRLSGTADNIRPFVERAVRDDEIRKNVRDAFDAAREIYSELIGPRGMVPLAVRVAGDEDIQDNLRRAVEDLRKAANRLQGKQDHSGRNTTLLLAGIAIGVLFNPVTGPATRSWLRGLLGNGDEDFTYQGNNSPN